MKDSVNQKRGSLTTKVLLVVILLGVLVAVSCGIIGYTQFTNVITSMYSNETTQIANIVLDYVDNSNIDETLTRINQAQTEEEVSQIMKETIKTDSYRDLLRFLDDLRRNIDVTDVYIADFRDSSGRVTSTGTYFAGVSGIRLDPNIFVVGEKIELNNDHGLLESIYETKTSPEEQLVVETELGPAMNAIVPILDNKDNMIGIISVQEPMSKLDSARSEYLITVTVYSLIITIIVTLIFAFINRKLIITPIKKITEATSNFVKNNNSFSADLSELKTNDEIQTLAESFNQMESDLENYITNLQKVTSEKERVETELNVATEIQKNMLPTIFPAFPHKPEFDIYATMEPAKEVGGDFYDLFLIDDDHLAFAVADVSGKGVPAALFMVIAKTLIKDHAMLGESPAEIFTNVNNLLCESNGADMFVTAWLGILELSTGKLTYVNAGHNAPVIKKHNGDFEYLKQRPGLVLAGLEGIPYRQYELQLEEGDKIYLYTDGVTEAQNSEEILYGEERLAKVLNEHANINVFELLPAVREDIDRFVKEADQFDDITMVGLEVKSQKDEEDHNE